MTDASDINSVAGVLKLYLRSSLFLLPCPLLCCYLCDVNQVGHLNSILTNPPSTWKSYWSSSPGNFEIQYFRSNTSTSLWSLHVSKLFAEDFVSTWSWLKLLRAVFLSLHISSWRTNSNANMHVDCIYFQPTIANMVGTANQKTYFGFPLQNQLILKRISFKSFCKWQFDKHAGDHPIPVLHSKNISRRMPQLLTAWLAWSEI